MNDGGPAFLSLRDWLAGQAMTAFFSRVDLTINDETVVVRVSRSAYHVADMMLAERDKIRGEVDG